MDSVVHRNLIAQWAFDTRPLLGRFHLWVEEVTERWTGRTPPDEGFSFAGTSLERALVMATAVTALGTKLFGRYGEGKGADKAALNRIKKDADAMSAYVMSESLWYLTRNLPENHAIMVSLGEGLMPKAGETPEMGSNPLLGFGRIYARPRVALALDRLVHRLLNDKRYQWDHFWRDLRGERITIWGAAIDTLENTSRFAKGSSTGPMTVLHLFDQPLRVSLPYEGYIGMLILPRAVVDRAAERSVLVDYFTPRKFVLDAIMDTYPGIKPEHVHVWTLGGPSRAPRIGKLWAAWREHGVHLVEDGWVLPSGMQAFNESGTYAPTFATGPYKDDDGNTHLFMGDGYAASAEAIQAASLDQLFDLRTSMVLYSSRYEVPADRERYVMHLDPKSPTFAKELADILQKEVSPALVAIYKGIIENAVAAGMPVGRRTAVVDDFFPKKQWRGLALIGHMLPDPYTGAPGVEEVGQGRYRVTTRACSEYGQLETTITLRLQETLEETRLVFSPLLDRFYAGQDFRKRPVKISDAGRIRNELQTLCSEALEYFDDNGIRVHFDRVEEAVLPSDKKALILDVLNWYKEHHPIWFRWLEIA